MTHDRLNTPISSIWSQSIKQYTHRQFYQSTWLLFGSHSTISLSLSLSLSITQIHTLKLLIESISSIPYLIHHAGLIVSNELASVALKLTSFNSFNRGTEQNGCFKLRWGEFQNGFHLHRFDLFVISFVIWLFCNWPLAHGDQFRRFRMSKLHTWKRMEVIRFRRRPQSTLNSIQFKWFAPTKINLTIKFAKESGITHTWIIFVGLLLFYSQLSALVNFGCSSFHELPNAAQ